MNKIAPIGGIHKSAASLLAEIMNDPDMAKCVVVVFDKDGFTKTGQYELSRAEMCYAAAIIQQMAFED